MLDGSLRISVRIDRNLSRAFHDRNLLRNAVRRASGGEADAPDPLNPRVSIVALLLSCLRAINHRTLAGAAGQLAYPKLLSARQRALSGERPNLSGKQSSSSAI